MNEDIKTTVKAILETYKVAMRNRIGQQKLLNQHDYDLKAIEKRTAHEVRMEVKEDGKPVFTNEILRDGETFKRLQANDQYLRLKDMYECLKDQLVEEDAVIQMSRMSMKAYDIITRD